jgi:hypothetical protein
MFTGIIYDGQSGAPMRLIQWKHTPTAASSSDCGSYLVSDYARLRAGETLAGSGVCAGRHQPWGNAQRRACSRSAPGRSGCTNRSFEPTTLPVTFHLNSRPKLRVSPGCGLNSTQLTKSSTNRILKQSPGIPHPEDPNLGEGMTAAALQSRPGSK